MLKSSIFLATVFFLSSQTVFATPKEIKNPAFAQVKQSLWFGGVGLISNEDAAKLQEQPDSKGEDFIIPEELYQVLLKVDV